MGTMRKVCFFALMLFVSFVAKSQVSLTNGSPSALIDFSNTTPTTVGTNPTSAFAGAGFELNPTTAGRLNSNAWAVTGWSNGDLAFGGTQITAATDYTRGVAAAAVTTGGFYASTVTPASASNPTFMIQPGGGDFAPGTLTLRIQNNGTSAITDINLTYNLYIRNDQGRSNSFNFSYSSDDVTYTPVGALDYTSTAAGDLLGWVIVGSAPSRSTAITSLSVAPGGFFYIRWSSADVGGAGSRDEFGLDDINLTATFAPPNTITTGAITGAPFTLADCSATGTGSVAFTSTDVYLAGNTFTAQMSDDIGSFATPIPLGSISLSGTAPSGSIPITIPAGTAPGVGYLIRIVSSSPVVTGSSSAAFQIIQNGPGGCQSSHTDYYRSFQTGDWGTLSTWESSNDNITFIPATLIPTSVANTILITTGHTVTIAGAASADQLTIPSGATLIHSSGTFTIADGTGDDVVVQSGGIFELSSSGNAPSFANATATCNLNTGAILRVSATGLTAAGVGVNAINYVYQHQSVLEYSLGSAFSTTAVTYFPNVNATTIPIFRTTNVGTITAGAGSATTFNGVFECNGGGVIWQNGGNKIFRNGITGTANMSTVASFIGNLVINGATAELGGTGTIDITNSPGSVLEIGTPTTVTMTSSKTIIGNISLLANSYIDAGTFNLTVSGNVTGGSSTSYIRTASTGSLILNTVDVAGKTFPVGHTSYNPLIIENVNSYNWTVNVNDGVVADPPNGITGAVLLTWNITPSTNPPVGGVDITFQFNAVTQTGVSFNPADLTETVQAWHRKLGYWLAAGTPMTLTDIGSNLRTVKISGLTEFSPYALSRISLPLPIKLISFNAIKLNSTRSLITWELAACCSRDARFEVQRSSDGINYAAIATITGSETNRFYTANDNDMQKGMNYYRLKGTDVDGKISYSKVIAIINDNKGLLLTTVAPNPVQDNMTVSLSAAKAEAVRFVIYDITGRPVKQWSATITEGSNIISVNARELTAGIYYLGAATTDSKTVIRFVKQ